MKKILSFLFCLTLALGVRGQSHMKFMDIPIDGTIKDFTTEMVKRGFTIEDSQPAYTRFSGKFTGRPADILLVGTPITFVPWKVVITFDKATSWFVIKNDYIKYVGLFKKKYGEPNYHYEFFKDLYYEGDGYELQALSNYDCYFYSYWERDNGVMSVKMNDNIKIEIVYEDDDNSELFESEREELESADI